MAEGQGYIGRAPGDSSVIIASQTFEPTGIQTNFTFASGYDPGYIDVYLNGARLIYANDYTATDGSTVALVDSATNGDVLECVAYKAFNVAAVDSSTGNFTVGQNLTVTGDTTATDINAVGIVTATGGLEVGVAGVGGTIAANGNTTLAGVVTATGGFSGDLNTAAQTNVTSLGTLTGLVVNGDTEFGASGVGGTITAVGNAILSGITTVGTGLTLADNIEARFGNAGDLKLYHNGTHSFISNVGGTGNVVVYGNGTNSIVLQAKSGDNGIIVNADDSTELYHDGNLKLATLSTGIDVTGVTSTTSFTVGPGIIQEKQYTVASALTGTVNMDVVTNGLVQSYTTNAAASFVVNLRGDGSTTFNSLMHIGQASVFTLYHASNNTSYYMTDFQIDGSSITEKWNGGSAPTAATGSGTDAYTFNIMKTADATFTVFANFSNFA